MTENKNIFYPASYLVMTVTSLLLIGALAGLGTILIDYWLNGVSNLLNDLAIFYAVASLTVVTPIHLLTYWQVRHTDKNQVTTFSLRFAHGLLGAYLFITVGSIILLSTWLFALWLNVWLGAGDADKHTAALSLALLQAIAWLVYMTRHFLRSRSDQSRPKYYVSVVASMSVVLLVLSLAFPALAYRDKARDFIKEQDLGQIHQQIGGYVDQHDILPAKLSDLKVNGHTVQRLGEYDYRSRGNTKFGIFGYTLCTTFARSNGEGRDTGFGFSSHSAGKQCFTRTAISFNKLNQDLTQTLNNDTARLRAGIQNFLIGAKQAVNQEVAGIENFASGQVKQLETNLEGLEGGTTELQKEMERLEGNLGGLEGNTGELAQDFAAIQRFLHDLGCLFGGC